MRKILCIILALVLLFCACGREDANEEKVIPQQDVVKEKKIAPEKIQEEAVEPEIKVELPSAPPAAVEPEKAPPKPQTEEMPVHTEVTESKEEPVVPEQKHEVVSIRICGDESMGQILEKTSISWEDGMTAFSALQKVIRDLGIHMEFSGGEANAYVEGIANLYEFDKGPLSGWMYRVNGEIVQKSSSACTLSPGDCVEWLYTLDMGKDLD